MSKGLGGATYLRAVAVDGDQVVSDSRKALDAEITKIFYWRETWQKCKNYKINIKFSSRGSKKRKFRSISDSYVTKHVYRAGAD